MQVALLNSIYKKKFEDQNLKSIYDDYVNDLYVVYLNALNDHNFDGTHDSIEIENSLPNGKIIKQYITASFYVSEIIFDSDEYEPAIKSADEKFLISINDVNKDKFLKKTKKCFQKALKKSTAEPDILFEMNAMFKNIFV